MSTRDTRKNFEGTFSFHLTPHTVCLRTFKYVLSYKNNETCYGSLYEIIPLKIKVSVIVGGRVLYR